MTSRILTPTGKLFAVTHGLSILKFSQIISPSNTQLRYILPPPSRPKYNDITLEQRKQSQQQQQQQHQSRNGNAQPVPPANPTQTLSTAAPTGQIIDKPQAHQQPLASGANNAAPANSQQPQQQQQQQPQQVVPSLAVQYVPNKGLKYYAVVPKHTEVSYGAAKQALLATNDLYDQQLAQSKYDKYDKLNGKYNPKLKKYKAYEKVKYMPYIVVSASVWCSVCVFLTNEA